MNDNKTLEEKVKNLETEVQNLKLSKAIKYAIMALVLIVTVPLVVGNPYIFGYDLLALASAISSISVITWMILVSIEYIIKIIMYFFRKS